MFKSKLQNIKSANVHVSQQKVIAIPYKNMIHLNANVLVWIVRLEVNVCRIVTSNCGMMHLVPVLVENIKSKCNEIDKK